MSRTPPIVAAFMIAQVDPPIHAYELGDTVRILVDRSRWAIWWDRIRLRRWEVDSCEIQVYECTMRFDLSAGAINKIDWERVR